MFVRKAVAAGAFYPASWNETKNYLDSIIEPAKQKIKPKAIIVPHAGYVYSGWVAAKAYELIEGFDTYIVMGPNHTGLGEEISVFEGEYEMPFGNPETDSEIANLIIENSTAKRDVYAHLQEHSIEVQLPFIEHISNKPYKIVPIVIGTHNRQKLKRLGTAIANAIKSTNKDVLIVVSSDMNHYEDQETTLKKDTLALDKIISLDEEGLLDVVERYNISMCGAAPSYACIVSAKLLGSKKASLVAHRTSGEVNMDFNQVVGYASVVVE